MKAQVEARALAKALRRASKYTGTPKGLPILGQARITAGATGLRIRTTDLDSAYAETVPHANAADVEPGVVQVSCKTLLATVAKHAKTVPVTLESNGGSLLHVRNGSNANAALPVTDPEDFPAIDLETPPSATTLNVDAADFARVFRAVAPMVSTDESRSELCGVNVELTRDGGLTLTGTNGHVLATETIAAAHVRAVIGPRPCSLIAPVGALLSFFDRKPDGQYELTMWPESPPGRFFQISQGSRVLRVRVLEGPFPDYQRVIPTGEAAVTARLEVDAAALGEAMVSVMPATDARTRQVLLETRLHVNGKTTLLLTAESRDNGKAQANVAILRSGDRGPIRCGVNGSYMALICKAAGSASLELEYRSAATAQLWRAGGLLVLLMPLRLADRTEAA